MPNGAVRVNSKATVACVISLIVCVYLIYSWASARSSMKSGSYHRRLDTWKKQDFVDIPKEVKELAKNVKVTEHTVKVVVDDKVIGHFVMLKLVSSPVWLSISRSDSRTKPNTNPKTNPSH